MMYAIRVRDNAPKRYPVAAGHIFWPRFSTRAEAIERIASCGRVKHWEVIEV